MKVREVIKRIEADGWVFVRHGGRASHRIYKKEGIQAEVVISGINSDEVSPGQLQDIRRKSGYHYDDSKVVLEQMPNNWCAHAPDLEDSIIATGKTREAVIQNFRDALLDLMDYQREQGWEVTDVTALEIRETRGVETLQTRLAAIVWLYQK